MKTVFAPGNPSAPTGARPSLLQRLKTDWPLLAALSLLAYALFTLLQQILDQHHFAYTLDDAYIHLAIAKNIAHHGVFGVSPFEFSSAESSLLWGLLLATLFKLLPGSGMEFAPLVLNLLLAFTLLAAFYRLCLMPRQDAAAVPAPLALGLLCLIAFLMPLPWLVFTGMEHLLHAVLLLIFVARAAHEIVAPQVDRRSQGALVVLALLLGAVRYEALFPIALVCLLLLLRRRVGLALVVGAAGLLPVLIYGALSVQQGGLWLPNSVLLKSRLGPPALRNFIETLPHPLCLFQLSVRRHLLLLFVVSVTLLAVRIATRRRHGLWSVATVFGVVFLGTTLIHLQGALIQALRGGSAVAYIRYDAYLLVLGLCAAIQQVRELLARPGELGSFAQRLLEPTGARLLVTLLPILGLFWAGWPRMREGMRLIPIASHNIYSQQYQTARFVERYYQNQGVALNDIGAVNFKADIRCTDLAGLATQAVANPLRAGTFDTRAMARICAERGVKVALIYSDWFDSTPPNWVLIGSWTIRDNVVCGPTVTVFATDPAEAQRLGDCFTQFAREMPRGVAQVRYLPTSRVSSRP